MVRPASRAARADTFPTLPFDVPIPPDSRVASGSHSLSRGVPQVPVEFESAVLGVSWEYEDGFEIAPHFHDCAQLVFAVSGVMTVTVGDGIWVTPPQRAVWVPTGLTHSIRMTGKVAVRMLYFPDDEARSLRSGCGVVSVSPLLREAILRIMDYRPPWPPDGAEARLVAVVKDEIRDAEITPLHLPMPEDPRALRVAEAIRAEPGDARRLEDWARLAGASERTLERLFERQTGSGFHAWRQQARMLRALEALASGLSVTETALLVGYETPSAFITRFRRLLGTTPGRYFSGEPTRPSRAPARD